MAGDNELETTEQQQDGEGPIPMLREEHQDHEDVQGHVLRFHELRRDDEDRGGHLSAI